MTPSLPEPLVPPDVDVTDWPSMLFDVDRCLTSDSWIAAAEDPRLGHVLMSLWCAAFHQVPAGSLPDIDATLLRLSMCPKPSEWRRVRDRALAEFVLCSDGRYYHAVVCEKALEAWLEKLAARLKSGTGNASRWKIKFDPGPILAQMTRARECLFRLNPQSRVLMKKRTAAVPQRSPGDGCGSPPAIPQRSHSDPMAIPQRSQEKRRDLYPPTPLPQPAVDNPAKPIADLLPALQARSWPQ